MKQLSTIWFAFFLTLNVLSQLTNGYKPNNNFKNNASKKLLEKRETHLLHENGADEWNSTVFTGLNNRSVYKAKIIQKNRENSDENQPSRNASFAFNDQNRRPRNLLQKKFIDGFNKVISKRLKKKPRQEIEILEDNQYTPRQDGYESPHYEDIIGNDYSERSDNNDNSYVTVIDNLDGKLDTDPYSTLTSDAAKSEYTNVENSMHEGENEESQMVSEEVKNVMGALMKSDSRINQFVAGEKQPLEESERLSYKPTGLTATKVVTILDNNKGEFNKSQNHPIGPPADVTIIEDQEDITGDSYSHPVLSMNAWNSILQAEKNLTNQDELHKQQGQHVPENSQGRISENKTQLPNYLLLPGNAPQNNNVSHSSGHFADLESSLKIFAGSKNQSGSYNNIKGMTVDVQRNSSGKTMLVTGEAEEASKGYSNYTQRNHSLSYLQNANNSTTSKLVANSFSFYHKPGKIQTQTDKSDGNNSHVKPTLFEPLSKNDSGQILSSQEHALYDTGHKTATSYQRPGMLVDVDDKGGPMKGGKPTNNVVDGKDLTNAQSDNSDAQEGEIVIPNEPYLTTGDHLPLRSSAPILKLPNRVTPSKVKIVYVRPMNQENPRKIWHENDKMDSFQNTGVVGKLNNSNTFRNHGYNFSTTNGLQTQKNREADVGVPLNQEQGTLAGGSNASAQMMHDNRIHGQEKTIGIDSKSNGQVSIASNRNSQNLQERIGFQSQENKLVDTSYPSFQSWSEEYHKLVEKLKVLYSKTQGSPLQAPDAKSQGSNYGTTDVEQMMREVSRFHNLYVGQNNKQKVNTNLSEAKGPFFSGIKGDQGGIVRNTEMVNPLEYSPFMSNRNYENRRDASTTKRVGANFLYLTKDVTGQVRSIEEPIKPLVSKTNGNDSSQRGSFLDDTIIANNSRQPNGDPNLTPVNQRLASSGHNVNGTNLSDTSGRAASADNSQSSHQVLMTYFGNETVLRKQLHNITDILRMNGFAVGQATESNASKEVTIDNGTSTSTSESKGSQELKILSNGRNDTGNLTNDLTLPWPSQVKNVSKEEEEGSLAKYIEDFISMLNPNNGTTTWNSNGTREGSSNPTQTDSATSSDTLKKENVTEFNNRVIIVVSPKSLKDLMTNRSHSSSMLVVNKIRPHKPGEVQNSTANVEAKGMNTAMDAQEHRKSLHNNQSHDESTKLDDHKGTSGEEKVESEGKEADLRLFYLEELKSLEVSFSQDFMSNWIYNQRSLDEMGISPSMLRLGIGNLGSPQRLKRVFKRALAGDDINVLVVGGSISAGGGIEKDHGNVEAVYHKALSDWWNNTVTSITSSKLKIDAIAIGGTDSEYFSYCVKNYMRKLPDIVIWELAANDYQRYKGRSFSPAKPLEQLTRIILSLPSHPALILANFFRGNYYRTAVGQDCPDSEDEGGKTIAQYYKLTSLSWRNVICSSIADHEMDLKKLFSSDGYHPSLLGHAHMSTLLISYLKGVFEQTISQEMILSRNHTLQSHQQDEQLTTLPKPIFDDPEFPKPFCWTLLTPDYNKKLRNTLPDLEFTEATGFQFANVSHWPIRRDRLRCLKAMQAGAMLKMKFVVPLPNELDDSEDRSERELAITTHNAFGGKGAIWVDGNRQSAKVIKEEGGQRRTQVDVLTRTLAPGAHTVTVSALEPGFCLSAVAVL